MSTTPWLLAHQTWEAVRQTRYQLAVLPWGATEAHNRHLPYGTDTIEAGAVAERAAGWAWQRGARTLVLPTVPFGVHTGQREVPFCLNMNPSTQMALLRDLAITLTDHGVGKLVIVNGHGANDFRQMIRELQGVLPLVIAQVNWYRMVDPTPFFTEPGDHAGELETSAMLALAPELVRPLDQAGPGTARRFAVRALREGWAWTPRRWVDVTADTGVGDPRAATADKGEAFLTAVTERLGEFLVEFAAVPPDGLFQD
jgi:creatinine amidohydrolase